jgi:Uma2 family endonuclease
LSLGSLSELEPDVSVVAGSPRDYVGTGHPTTALLVVEVSVSSLELDRGAKARIYARARIEDYWILNLAQKQLEVYRGIVIEPGRRARAH